MSDTPQTKDVGPWMVRGAAVLRAVYPDGVPAAEYEPLVYLLCESMSMRGAARTLDLCGIREYSAAYNDIQGIAYNHAAYAAAAKPVLEKLTRHGFVPDAE